jgi:BlaI family penicillinase repressor
MIRISEAEAVVMEVLWGQHPLSADEVMARLPGGNDWAEATVKTLLNRLLNKGAIEAQKQGRRYLYTPLVERDAWVLEESSSLLDRLFDGRVAPLVAHFSQYRRLSRDDVAQLRKLLEELDDEQH